MDLRVAQGPHDAGSCGQRGADGEGEGDDLVHGHAEHTGGLDVFGDGLHGEAGLGVVHDVQQTGHEDGGDARDQQGERHETRTADGDDAHQPFRLMHRAGQTGEDHDGQTFEEEGNSDGADECRDSGGVTQGAVGDLVHEHAESGGTDDGHHHGHRPGQAEKRGAVENEIRAQHQDIAVGEVDEAQDAVHHGVADGDEAIERTQREGIEKVLEEQFQSHEGTLSGLHREAEPG